MSKLNLSPCLPAFGTIYPAGVLPPVAAAVSCFTLPATRTCIPPGFTTPDGWTRCNHLTRCSLLSHLPLHECSVLPTLPPCSLQCLHALDSLIQQGGQLIALACSKAAPCSCTTTRHATPVSRGQTANGRQERASAGVTEQQICLLASTTVPYGHTAHSICLQHGQAPCSPQQTSRRRAHDSDDSWHMTKTRTDAVWCMSPFEARHGLPSFTMPTMTDLEHANDQPCHMTGPEFLGMHIGCIKWHCSAACSYAVSCVWQCDSKLLLQSLSRSLPS